MIYFLDPPQFSGILTCIKCKNAVNFGLWDDESFCPHCKEATQFAAEEDVFGPEPMTAEERQEELEAMEVGA